MFFSYGHFIAQTKTFKFRKYFDIIFLSYGHYGYVMAQTNTVKSRKYLEIFFLELWVFYGINQNL